MQKVQKSKASQIYFKVAPTQQIKMQLQEQDIKSKPYITNEPKNLLEWYIQYILCQLNKKKIPRISSLKQASSSLSRYLENIKYLNDLFLQQESIVKLIKKCDGLVQIAYILRQFKNRKTKGLNNYPIIIQTAVKERVFEIFDNRLSQGQICSLFRTNFIQSFMEEKNTHRLNQQHLYTAIDKFQLNQLNEQISIIYNYLIRPNFKNLSQSGVFRNNLYRMAFWLVAIDGQDSQKDTFLLDCSNFLFNTICYPHNSNRLQYILTFSFVLNFLSIKAKIEDQFKYVNLAPLLLQFKDKVNYKQMIKLWVLNNSNNQINKISPLEIESLFRNSINTGCFSFSFNIIKSISEELESNKCYHTLFHIFQKFIRKDFIQIILPHGVYLSYYMEIISFYAIGFINRDRFDGELELDLLTSRLQNMLFRDKFNFNKDWKIIMMFYKIYQNRFVFLSNAAKKFLEDLETIYEYTIEVSEIHRKIQKEMFKEAGVQTQQSFMNHYKKSERYLGITNIGNICYLSSFIQALYMTKKFKTMILQSDYDTKLPLSLTKVGSLIKVFTDLSDTKFLKSSQIDVKDFKQTIPQPFCSSWQQHDSAEFGRTYIDHIVNELQLKSKTQLNFQPFLAKLKNLFYQKISLKLICKKCSKSKTNTENILDFILPLSNQTQVIYVSELLRKFFDGEELDINNQLYCQECLKKTQVSSKTEPEQFSQYLMATIGMFSYSGNVGHKIIKPFLFEFTINFRTILPKLNLPDIIYHLYAFIVHLGDRAERGHYVCYARNIEQNPMLWYCFDDGYVTEREITNAQDFKFGELETPYILFYTSANKVRTSLKEQIQLDKSHSLIRKASLVSSNLKK